MAYTMNGDVVPCVQIAPPFTNIIMSDDDRKAAVQAAFWVTGSPCEWKWTPEQQALMAQYCLWACQRLQAIEDLSTGMVLERAKD